MVLMSGAMTHQLHSHKIADLIVEIPIAGDMCSRCQEYLYTGELKTDIIISEENYREWKYPKKMPRSIVAYMESAYQFYRALLKYNGFYLHSSAVELDGKAYLFSGNSGVGKSTHTRLWQQCFGEKACVFNDDKPALRYMNQKWYAYGTPWCGKDGINENRKVPLQGICFLKQSEKNSIRRLDNKEAIAKIVQQTLRQTLSATEMDLLLACIGKLVEGIPVYELENRPEPQAAYLSYRTMSGNEKEV